MLKIAFDKIFKHPLDKNHRFPMAKYELLPEQLLIEGTCSTNNFFSPSDIDEKVILETHSSEYYQRLTNFQLDKKELRAIGFPMSQKLIEREKKIVQGTIECALNSKRDYLLLRTEAEVRPFAYHLGYLNRHHRLHR